MSHAVSDAVLCLVVVEKRKKNENMKRKPKKQNKKVLAPNFSEKLATL